MQISESGSYSILDRVAAGSVEGYHLQIVDEQGQPASDWSIASVTACNLVAATGQSHTLQLWLLLLLTAVVTAWLLRGRAASPAQTLR